MGREDGKWKERCEVDGHISHAMIRIGPSEVASSSSRAVFPSEIEIPDGFRETLTDAWPGDGPLRCFTLLNLENFSPFPLFLLYS